MSDSGDDDVYSADTVIRDASREELDAIRETQKASEKRRAAQQETARAEEQALSEESPKAKETAAPETKEVTKEEAKEEPKTPSVKTPVATPAAKSLEKSEAKAIEKKAAAVPVHAPPQHPKAIEPPVTLGELTIAFAAAIALIVVGFYVIGSAF